MIKKIIGVIVVAAVLITCNIPVYAAEETPAAYTEEDLRLMSSIIFLEAGNQCYEGQQAVGIVVINRVESELYPNTISEVLWQSGQFFNPSCKSFWYSCLNKYDNGEMPESCINAAIYALEKNKNIYYNNNIINFSDFLFFARYRKDCQVKIQDHQFS